MASRQKQVSRPDEEEFFDMFTKEEREALLNKKMEEIRRKNEAIQRRHAEIEADRLAAEKKGQAVSLKSTAWDDGAPGYHEETPSSESHQRRPRGKETEDQDSRSGHNDHQRGAPRSSNSENRGQRAKQPEDKRSPHQNRSNRNSREFADVRSQQPRSHGNRPDPASRQDRAFDHSQDETSNNRIKSNESGQNGNVKTTDHTDMKGVATDRERPSKFSTGRGKRLSQMSKQKLKAPEYEKMKRNTTSDSNNEPPPDPGYKFLSDRSREVSSLEDSAQKSSEPSHPSARHPRNYGGSSFDNVKSKIKTEKAAARSRPGPPGPPVDLAMHMTGRERDNYKRWLSERQKIDEARVKRQRDAKGQWTREWDSEKSETAKIPSPPVSRRMEPGRRPAGRIGSGRFISQEFDEKPKVTRDDSVPLREKDQHQGRRIRPVSWGGPDIQDYSVPERCGGGPKGGDWPAQRYRGSSQSSDEGQRHVQEQNDQLLIKIGNNSPASVTSPPGSGRRFGTNQSRRGHSPHSPGQAGAERGPQNHRGTERRGGEHRGRGSDRRGSRSSGDWRGQRSDSRGANDSGYFGDQRDSWREAQQQTTSPQRGKRRIHSHEEDDVWEDTDPHNHHQDVDSSTLGAQRGGRGRGRGRGARRRQDQYQQLQQQQQQPKQQQRGTKAKSVSFQVQPVIHDVEMEWDHGTDMNPIMDQVAHKGDEGWVDTPMSKDVWATDTSPTRRNHASDPSTRENSNSKKSNNSHRKDEPHPSRETSESPARDTEPSDDSQGFVDENGEPVEDDDQEWEDDDDDEEDDGDYVEEEDLDEQDGEATDEPRPEQEEEEVEEEEEDEGSYHDSSAESLERFIQEHTLRVDVCDKTGDISLEGSSAHSTPSTSSTSSPARSTRTVVASAPGPRTPVSPVSDWAAAVDSHILDVVSPTSELKRNRFGRMDSNPGSNSLDSSTQSTKVDDSATEAIAAAEISNVGSSEHPETSDDKSESVEPEQILHEPETERSMEKPESGQETHAEETNETTSSSISNKTEEETLSDIVDSSIDGKESSELHDDSHQDTNVATPSTDNKSEATSQELTKADPESNVATQDTVSLGRDNKISTQDTTEIHPDSNVSTQDTAETDPDDKVSKPDTSETDAHDSDSKPNTSIVESESDSSKSVVADPESTASEPSVPKTDPEYSDTKPIPDTDPDSSCDSSIPVNDIESVASESTINQTEQQESVSNSEILEADKESNISKSDLENTGVENTETSIPVADDDPSKESCQEEGKHTGVSDEKPQTAENLSDPKEEILEGTAADGQTDPVVKGTNPESEDAVRSAGDAEPSPHTEDNSETGSDENFVEASSDVSPNSPGEPEVNG